MMKAGREDTGKAPPRLDFAGARRVLMAVSGGSDSMALLRLAGGARGDGAEIVAATIDHGLREGSAAEAGKVAAWCRRAGVDHVTLRWEGEKPSTGIQKAARDARYRLLALEAERRRLEAIATAHTADDQAETVFMRLARGAGTRGLSGIRAATFIAAGAGEPVRLLRPLASYWRDDLRTYLESQSQSWLEDPSNDDARFERARIRGLLAALEEQHILTRAALVRTAQRLHGASERLDREIAAGFARAGGCFHRLGWASLTNFATLSGALVARLVYAVGGGEFEPSEEDAQAAMQAATRNGTATLGGAALWRHGETLFAGREPAALHGRAGIQALRPVQIEPGESALWDRRFIIRNDGPAAISVAPYGHPQAAPDIEAAARLHAVAPDIMRAAPAVFRADGAHPAGHGVRVRSLAEERFLRRVLRFP